MMPPKHLTSILGILLALSAFAGSSIVAVSDDSDRIKKLEKSSACIGTLPPFGNLGVGRGGFAEFSGTIVTNNDGKWCWISFGWAYHQTPSYELVQPPQHGKVLVGFVEGRTRFAYQPDPDFVGDDKFIFRTHVVQGERVLPVSVTVNR